MPFLLLPFLNWKGCKKIWNKRMFTAFTNGKLCNVMAPHSSTLAWKIPWMEEPGGLQSMGSLKVGHDWATSLSLFTFMHWRRKWQPNTVFLPGESQGRGSLVGCRLWGCRVGHDWSDLAAAAAAPKKALRATMDQKYLWVQRETQRGLGICWLAASHSLSSVLSNSTNHSLSLSSPHFQ